MTSLQGVCSLDTYLRLQHEAEVRLTSPPLFSYLSSNGERENYVAPGADDCLLTVTKAIYSLVRENLIVNNNMLGFAQTLDTYKVYAYFDKNLSRHRSEFRESFSSDNFEKLPLRLADAAFPEMHFAADYEAVKGEEILLMELVSRVLGLFRSRAILPPKLPLGEPATIEEFFTNGAKMDKTYAFGKMADAAIEMAAKQGVIVEREGDNVGPAVYQNVFACIGASPVDLTGIAYLRIGNKRGRGEAVDFDVPGPSNIKTSVPSAVYTAKEKWVDNAASGEILGLGAMTRRGKLVEHASLYAHQPTEGSHSTRAFYGSEDARLYIVGLSARAKNNIVHGLFAQPCDIADAVDQVRQRLFKPGQGVKFDDEAKDIMALGRILAARGSLSTDGNMVQRVSKG